jgi:hypothetical protein
MGPALLRNKKPLFEGVLLQLCVDKNDRHKKDAGIGRQRQCVPERNGE